MATFLVTESNAWDRTSVENLVLELLGKLLGEEPGNLRVRLTSEGIQMPIDSLDMFDMLQEFRQITGIRVPVRKLGHRTLRSVSAFATFVTEETSK